MGVKAHGAWEGETWNRIAIRNVWQRFGSGCERGGCATPDSGQKMRFALRASVMERLQHPRRARRVSARARADQFMDQYRSSWLPAMRTRSPGCRSPGVLTSKARIDPSFNWTEIR